MGAMFIRRSMFVFPSLEREKGRKKKKKKKRR